MSKPIVSQGIRLEPVPLSKLPGPRKFNEVQSICEGLANLKIVFVASGKTQFLLSNRNAVLQISLEDIANIEIEAAYKDLWALGSTYDPGDIVRTTEADPTAASRIFRDSFWVWVGTEAGNSAAAPDFYNTNYGVELDDNWRCISSIPGPNANNGLPPVTGNVVAGGVTFTFYEGLLYAVA